MSKKMFAKELQTLESCNRIMGRAAEPTDEFKAAHGKMAEIAAALSPLLVELLEAGLLDLVLDSEAKAKLPNGMRVVRVDGSAGIELHCDSSF
jgi:hypothetical protein